MRKMRILEEVSQILTKCMTARENRKNKAVVVSKGTNKAGDLDDPLTYPPGWNDMEATVNALQPPQE